MTDFTKIEEPPTLVRLTSLLAAGYQLDISTPSNAVFLRHPARRRMRYWHLMLDSEGRVVGSYMESGKDAEMRIRPDDHERFAAFVSRVPSPTWWESHKDGIFWLLISALPILAVLWMVVRKCRMTSGDAY